jgi:hypothetical protein
MSITERQWLEEGHRDREPSILVNDERTILVTTHPDGSTSVALREHSGAIWGPPIDVHPES